MNVDRQIVLVSGAPGAGKTTLARALAKRLGVEQAILVELTRG